MKYRIEYEISWLPRKCESDCYDYIQNRNANTKYADWHIVSDDGRDVVMHREFYDSQKHMDAKQHRGIVIRTAKRNPKTGALK